MYWLQGPVGRAGEIRRKRHAGAGSFERGRGGDDPMWADEGMWTYHLDQFGDGLLMFTVYKMVSHWVYGIWFTTLLDSGIFCHGLIPKWFRYKVSAEHVHGNGQGLKKTWHGLSQKKANQLLVGLQPWHVKQHQREDVMSSFRGKQSLAVPFGGPVPCRPIATSDPPKIQSSAWSWRVNRVKGSTMFYNFISQFELV